MNNKEYKKLEELVYNYPTEYKEGFMWEEENKLLEKFPDIKMDRYTNAMRGNTCMVKNGHIITYHCDILKALVCGIEDRDLTVLEWD